MMERQQLLGTLNALLQPERFKDYCPNGLQVEGSSHIRKLVSGVTASRALIEAAIDLRADALLVHHGLFWRGHDGCVTGWLRQRLGLLLQHNISLFAYHLPLDAHPEWGNNAQWGLKMGFRATDRFGDQQLGWLGEPSAQHALSADALADHVQRVLGRSVTLVAAKPGPLRRVAWCSGGAQGYFEDAIVAGADIFLTGEMSEPQAHLARECGVSFIACGHHASERYGAPALAAHVCAAHGIEHVNIDIDNPA